MSDKQKAARAIGYLEGMSALWWAFVGEKLSDEMVAAYDEAVETLRKRSAAAPRAGGAEAPARG